jgi:hypothetical protein
MLLFVVNFCATTFALVFLFLIFIITTKNENGKAKIHHTSKVPSIDVQKARNTKARYVFLTRYEASSAHFYKDSDRPDMNKRVGLDRKLSTAG